MFLISLWNGVFLFLRDRKSTAVFPINSLAFFPVFVSSISSTKLLKRPLASKTMWYFSSTTAAWSRLNPDCSSSCKKACLERFFRLIYNENDHDMSQNNQEGIHLALPFNYSYCRYTLPGFHCKDTHFTQNVMVFGYHRYNIWRHQWENGKPFKSRKVCFSPNFVNNNQIQKICMEPGRFKF